jgi:hypothetical protein
MDNDGNVYDLEEQEQISELKTWWRMYGNLVTGVCCWPSPSGWPAGRAGTTISASRRRSLADLCRRAEGGRRAGCQARARGGRRTHRQVSRYRLCRHGRSDFGPDAVRRRRPEDRQGATAMGGRQGRRQGLARSGPPAPGRTFCSTRRRSTKRSSCCPKSRRRPLPRASTNSGATCWWHRARRRRPAPPTRRPWRQAGGDQSAAIPAGRDTQYRDLLQMKADSLGDK